MTTSQPVPALQQRFATKVALVTGSTQGLGAAIARRFASEGASGIVVTGRDQTRGPSVVAELEALGTRAVFVRADLGNHDDVLRLIEQTDEAFGRIDVLVNSAGTPLRGTIIDTDRELWDTIMNVNVRAPFFLTQGAIKIMRREGTPGTIVNIGSVTGYGGPPTLTPYSISKGALIPFTKSVGYAMSRDRIRINTLMIGWMDTPGEDATQKRFHGADDGWLTDAEAKTPFGRLLKVDEVASAVAFLASDDSGMMTGAVVDFDQTVIGAGPAPALRQDEVP
ncbi:MAG: SDR family oxidoreductase [Acidobacteria bacterium]|nr:SDR family oxidoreductase [Acidobacteriota bacterium]MCH8985130.1 SDR family oxidoreductase [Acidobacteriota bacterium]